MSASRLPPLPLRLRAVAAAVPDGARSVADVGAGDGQLARHLAARGLRVVATERRPSSFARLRVAVPRLDCRLGEGLAVLRPGEVEGVVLAGMGGHSIARILDASPAVARALDWLVLQPQQHAQRLIEWLEPAGYRVRAKETAAQGDVRIQCCSSPGMNVPELALHHMRLDQRAAGLRAQIERLRALLAGDPESDRLEREVAEADGARRELDLRVRDREREAESQRARLRGRERELMSGRIRNPTELMKLNQEVDHLKAAVRAQEDGELELMERQEALEADIARLGRELAAARERTAAAAPELRQRLEHQERELPEVEAERDATWERLPQDWQVAYRRVRSRQADPVAEVVSGQCRACRVALTSSGMQAVRRAALHQCDNCGRILVVT